MARKAKTNDLLRQVRQRRLHRRRQRIWLGAAACFLILAGLGYLAQVDYLLIDRVLVVGVQEQVTSQALKEAAEKELRGEYLFFFPRRHWLWLGTTSMALALERQFPDLAGITVSRQGFDAVVISGRERQAAFLRCAVAGTPCFLMDETGLIFAPAAPAGWRGLLELRGPLDPSPLGRPGFSSSDLGFISALREEIADRGEKIFDASARLVRVELKEDGDFWFWFSGMPDGRSFYLIANRAQSPERLAFFLAEAFRAPTLAEASALEYLDLRFIPKIFYRRYN